MNAELHLRNRLPAELVTACEEQMAKIGRWKGGLVESKLPEFNLDHVNSLHFLASEVRESYPALSTFFDWDAITDMIDIHDVGEIISGDLVRSQGDYAEIKAKHKRKERLGFVVLANKYIKDETARAEVLATYRRYVDLDEHDPEALFTHLLDKIQAVRFGLSNVYNDKILPMNLSLIQATKSVDLIFEFATPLLKITSGRVRSDLFALVQVEIGRYRINGFPALAAEARTRLFDHK
ncbi:MAG: hypothetical protein HYV38_03045 [Candidatus Levybacteria bacterium]|nr:hypothetical protein [Candidatus Levybacteria bacterium]